jgi:hypothetical protein
MGGLMSDMDDLHKWLLACPTGEYEVSYEDEDFIHLHIPKPKGQEA